MNHRYSDDLDFFLNNHPAFKEQCRSVLSCLKDTSFERQVGTTSDTFLRIFLKKEDVLLKVDFVNDVEFHCGNIVSHELFNRLDDWKNILSNKICALSRAEPKDYADILFIADQYRFNWKQVLIEAKNKDLWVEPIEVSI